MAMLFSRRSFRFSSSATIMSSRLCGTAVVSRAGHGMEGEGGPRREGPQTGSHGWGQPERGAGSAGGCSGVPGCPHPTQVPPGAPADPAGPGPEGLAAAAGPEEGVLAAGRVGILAAEEGVGSWQPEMGGVVGGVLAAGPSP